MTLALTMQEAVVPVPVGLDLRGLRLEPALMVVEIFLGRDQDLARPDHRLLDDSDRGLERSDSLPVGILVLRRPGPFLTHWADHAERLS